MTHPVPLLGLDTFGDITRRADGGLTSPAQVLRDVVEEAVLADRLGLHAFGVGEHHRPDFAISAPEVMLAAIAGRTEQIRLGTAVTVLSTDDPVRVFERFSTLDAISNGRAEIIVGRGSFTESFPLFGFDLNEYEILFEERLDLFVKLLEGQPVTWSGRTRAPLDRQLVHPALERPLTVWAGVGGSPQSVVRAARHGLGLMLAIIGGDPRRFTPYVDLYRHTMAKLGKEPIPVGMHSPGYVAETDAAAREEFWPGFREMMGRIGAERGWPPMSRAQFEAEVEHGSLYVGAPDTVARRIAEAVTALDVARFDLKYSAGTLEHPKLMRCIELFATEVLPRVGEMALDKR